MMLHKPVNLYCLGDAVLLKGQNEKDTVCIALADESCPDKKIKMNKVNIYKMGTFICSMW